MIKEVNSQGMQDNISRLDLPVETVEGVRDKIINAALFVGMTIGFLALMGSLYRATVFGWKPLMAFHIVAWLTVLLSFIMRRHLSFRVRSCFLIALAVALAMGGLATWGLIGLGIPLFLSASLLATLLFGFRAGLAISGVSVTYIAAVGIGVTSGQISFEFDVATYAVSSTSWIVACIIILIHVGICITGFSMYQGALIDFIHKLKQQRTELINEITRRKQTDDEFCQLKKQLEEENHYLQEEIRVEHGFEEIVGDSPALKEVLQQLEQVAPTQAIVLIQGESGTGKELFARAIHERSPRHSHPLIKVNCAALSSTLLESELFGHEKGSFTGATQQRKGRFELADGGTLFLDEIGELALDMQAKLLRVLQEKEFERVGGNKTLRVDVRVIAATNRDLFQAVQVGEFRDDLYYRLNSFPIQLPALRDRAEDIAQLVRHYSQGFSREMGREISEIRPQVMRLLQQYAWPGNVRELKNVIERAVIISQGAILRIDKSMLQHQEVSVRAPDTRTLAEVEYDHIVMTLERCNWKISGAGGAAQCLGLNPSTLRGRLRKLDISKDEASDRAKTANTTRHRASSIA